MSVKKITVQGIRCPVCLEELWSKYTHDFHYCGCGYCFVDGGREYLRYGWGVKPDKDNEDITPEEWSEIYEANERLDKPKKINIEVPYIRPPTKEGIRNRNLKLWIAPSVDTDKKKKKIVTTKKKASVGSKNK